MEGARDQMSLDELATASKLKQIEHNETAFSLVTGIRKANIKSKRAIKEINAARFSSLVSLYSSLLISSYILRT